MRDAVSEDRFALADAAYVLGALDAAEVGEFEAHLPACSACRHRVAEARSTAALLGAVRDASPATMVDEPPPDTLLPVLLARARRERRGRRAVVGAIAAVAAACLVALVVAVRPGPSASTMPTTVPAARAQALHAITQARFVTATAALRPQRWGTEIDVRCKYAHGRGDTDAGSHTYGLRVVDRDGRTHDAGSWTQSGEQTVVFTGGTEVRRERIARVQVTLADGTPILQLTV